MKKYKCLLLDHDDTVVDSTAQVHHPSFVEALKELRPDVSISLEDYFLLNFEPGFLEYCTDVLHFTEADFDRELDIWKEYVNNHTPKVYPGMKKIIERHKAEGGIICVISHSFDFNIKRDYEANGLPQPDMIFGWEQPKELRKPSPYALEQISKKYNLEPSDMVMIDDLKPGYDMAKAYGVTFVGAGWANDIAKIREFMKRHSDYYFADTDKLYNYLFEE